ncbi:hypothetical protein VTN00DRAFT_6294 [Thermoascus crustaceus]|uniref:uncharacterized protein n=1 Tax=Thermoascus crustaceus TaxID=5088 RepID=UPI003741EABF
MSKPDLGDLLAEVLPKDVKTTLRHISTPPTPCEAIFSAPPGEDPETTFCENHFLTVSINRDDKDEEELIVFGIEVLIYSTDRLTTIFISKADSTGNLRLLKTTPKISLIRVISTTFLSYLVQTRQRPGVRLVLSLFARAQNQYLFPGSIDNVGKHVLDDRGLIKWWCRVADPILREYEPESRSQDKGLLDQRVESVKSSATAYLIVPGCDKFETRAFFPPTAKFDDKEHPRWVNSYPLHQVCKNPGAPPRCLVPRFPDDPKSRFLLDLDDELPERTEASDSVKKENAGQWRSVRSLDQFWEMMSFRQECSAGRLTGFLWLVVNPPGVVNSDDIADKAPRPQPSEADTAASVLPTPETSQTENVTAVSPEEPTEKVATTAEAHDPSTESVREPDSKKLEHDERPPRLSSTSTERPVKAESNVSNPFLWPEAGRGHVIFSDNYYKTAIEFLLEQDFENEEVSISSTKAWVSKVASLADTLWWGQHVVGKNIKAESATKPPEAGNLMDTGLVRKRKKEDAEDGKAPSAENGEANLRSAQPEPSPSVNVLNASFVRKKKKA